MKILLWILQIVLGLYNLIGGFYIISNYAAVVGDWVNSLPTSLWIAIGVLQILFAFILILPGLIKKLKRLVPVAATCLAIIMAGLCALNFKSYSLPGLCMAFVPAVLALYLAYKRSTTHKL